MQKYFTGYSIASSIKKSFLFFLILILQTNISAKEKITIAVLDFSSADIPQKYEKIIRNEIEYNIYQATGFRVLEREKIDIVIKENTIKNIGSDKRNIMLSVGKTLSADYILTGDIIKDDDKKYTAKLRIINVTDGTMLYSYSQTLDELAELKDFAKTISGKATVDIAYFDINGKIKDDTQTEIKQDNRDIGKQESPDYNFLFNTALMPVYLYPVGNFNTIIKHGYGLGISAGLDNIFINNFNACIEADIIKLDREEKNAGYFLTVPVLLCFNYAFYFYESYFIAPEIKSGIIYFSYRSKDDAHKNDYSKSAIETISLAGIVLGKKINEHINIALGADYGIIFEKNDTLQFVSSALAIRYTY